MGGDVSTLFAAAGNQERMKQRLFCVFSQKIWRRHYSLHLLPIFGQIQHKIIHRTAPRFLEVLSMHNTGTSLNSSNKVNVGGRPGILKLIQSWFKPPSLTAFFVGHVLCPFSQDSRVGPLISSHHSRTPQFWLLWRSFIERSSAASWKPLRWASSLW